MPTPNRNIPTRISHSRSCSNHSRKAETVPPSTSTTGSSIHEPSPNLEPRTGATSVMGQGRGACFGIDTRDTASPQRCARGLRHEVEGDETDRARAHHVEGRHEIVAGPLDEPFVDRG